MNVPLQVQVQIQMIIQSIISLETLCSIVKNLSIKYFILSRLKKWRKWANSFFIHSF